MCVKLVIYKDFTVILLNRSVAVINGKTVARLRN